MAIDQLKYSTSSFPFPSDEINPDDKDDKWGLKCCQALYSKYCRGETVIPKSAVDEIMSLRRLADGRQDIAQYQKILADEADDNNAMAGYMNINWDVFNVMPKFLRVVEGIMEQTDHQVVATAVDPTSTEEREAAKLNMEFRMRFKDQIQQIEQGLGIDVSKNFIPDSMEELNIYEGAGGFKLAKEIEIEQGLDYTFYISSWKQIKKRIIRDACVLNELCVKDYVDQFTKKVKVRYVDPQYLVAMAASGWDHRKLFAAGELTKVSIADLRKELNIPENELMLLAQDFNNKYGNISLTNYTYDEDSRTSTYDDFLVDVMDCEWQSVNSEFYTTRKNKYDNEVSYKEEWGKTYSTDKKKTSKYDIHVFYRGKWIVGTDYVYDFGLQHDIPRPGKKEVESSYHFYKLPGRSLVSLSETHLHAMAITFYKFQNHVATARPSGLAIEFTSLQNMALGKGKKSLEPLELLKIATQTGHVIYRSTTHRGMPNIPGNQKPVQELEGGLGNALVEYITAIDFSINAVREITGINKVADASSPNQEMLVGVSELAIAATNNALRPIYSAYIHIKEQAAKNISLRLQVLIKHNKEAYEGYVPVIGRIGVQVISVGADVVDADYFIKYEARPTEERKRTILDAAKVAMTPDKDGVASLYFPDFIMIERLCESGTLKYAEAYLNYRIQKNKQRQMQIQRENMMLDGQREKELSDTKTKNKLLEDQSTIKKELTVYEGKKKIDDEYAEKEHQRKMKELGVQASLGIVQDAVKQGVAVTE